jgi:transcriptional regulator with XRE-family HTH domain
MPPLRTLRKARGLTQQKLAERAGVRRTTLSAIETGRKRPRLLVMRRVCEALSIAPIDVDEFRLALGKLSPPLLFLRGNRDSGFRCVDNRIAKRFL